MRKISEVVKEVGRWTIYVGPLVAVIIAAYYATGMRVS